MRAVSGGPDLLSRLLGAPVSRTAIQLKEEICTHSLYALGEARKQACALVSSGRLQLNLPLSPHICVADLLHKLFFSLS